MGLVLLLALGQVNQPTGDRQHDAELSFVQAYMRDVPTMRRTISASVCHWKHVEQLCLGDIRAVRARSKIGGVVDLEAVNDAQVCVESARTSAHNTVALLKGVATVLPCTPELTHLGNCIDGYDEPCAVGEFEEAQHFIHAVRELLGLEVMSE